jgi:hypothetical protein
MQTKTQENQNQNKRHNFFNSKNAQIEKHTHTT